MKATQYSQNCGQIIGLKMKEVSFLHSLLKILMLAMLYQVLVVFETFDGQEKAKEKEVEYVLSTSLSLLKG